MRRRPITSPDRSSIPTGFDSRLTRRALIKAAGLGALATSAPFLTGCGSNSGKTAISLHETKPEVIPYFDDLVAKFNAQSNSVEATHDSTTDPIADFVRNRPPDLFCDNYNLTTSIFVARGVLSDLADAPEAALIDPTVQALVSQYTSYKGQTSALPYSIAAEGVIYNKDHFKTIGINSDADVPKTWTDYVGVCKELQSAKVVPIYSTFLDPWTMQQGIFDYVVGGMIDVADFYQKLVAEGADFNPNSPVTFSKDFREPSLRMLELLPFMNDDRSGLAYTTGTPNFAHGTGAMYYQGPWAFSGISATNPKANMGTFPLPVTDDADDTKCRVNLDLACYIPTGTGTAAAAAELMSFLYGDNGATCIKYNKDNLAFAPLKGAPRADDPKVAGLNPYVSAGKFYQGAGTYIPLSIPVGNYIQQFLIDQNVDGFLSKLDADWQRLVVRTAA
jgi:raffinose/stachyose/melibiose transport system substrate-binding protein